MQIGFKLSAEDFGPMENVRLAVRAEEAGFDFVEMSDHFLPWHEAQEHSPFTWSVLGAIANETERIDLATGVTCPTMRYHPAIVAQAAATMALLSDGRFTLGLGSGERLNEHILGLDWPAVPRRLAMLREALEIIRMLWSGGYHSFEGDYLALESARILDLPDTPPPLALAVSGPESVEIAKEYADGIFAVSPESALVEQFSEAQPNGPKYAEVGLSWAPTEDAAVESAFQSGRFSLLGTKAMTELPLPADFDEASTTVRLDDVRETVGCGPDPDRHMAAIRPYLDAGFDHIVLHDFGPDPDGFFEFFTHELRPRLIAG